MFISQINAIVKHATDNCHMFISRITIIVKHDTDNCYKYNTTIMKTMCTFIYYHSASCSVVSCSRLSLK